jgi:hypothetical protein
LGNRTGEWRKKKGKGRRKRKGEKEIRLGGRSRTLVSGSQARELHWMRRHHRPTRHHLCVVEQAREHHRWLCSRRQDCSQRLRAHELGDVVDKSSVGAHNNHPLSSDSRAHNRCGRRRWSGWARPTPPTSRLLVLY